MQSDKTVCINNPLAFMNSVYLLNHLKKQKIISENDMNKIKFIFTYAYQIPTKVYIIFVNENQCNNFIKSFNNKSFEKSLQHEMHLSKEEVPSELPHDPCERLTKYTVVIDYQNLWRTWYEVKEKEKGLILIAKDPIDRMRRAAKWLLQKIGSTIIKGQSLMNISLPVFIFDKRSMLQVFVWELSSAPYFLTKAYYTPNAIEKLKLITTFFLSQIYVSPIQSKPFNPIIGETFQARIGDINIYLEQTLNKPPTANVYCYDDAKRFKLYGYLGTTASTGANSIKAVKLGKMYLEYKDGAKFRFYYPQVWVSGTVMGKNQFNYRQHCLVVDEVNQMGALIKFNPYEKGFFGKMFGNKKHSTTPDVFKGDILKMKDIQIDKNGCKHSKEKKATSYAEITGSWLHEVVIDNEVFWRREDYQLFQIYEMEFKLPSDSTLRKDLKLFIEGKEEEAQVEKEKMEEMQRRDRKLRGGDYKKEEKK